MFETKNLPRYAVILGVILVVTAFSNNIKSAFETDDDYEMIKKYLLNESPLYGYNRPKIWIHSAYETNARQWKDFQSRNTTNLNQNYIHLTIKTIINHCGEDFNICLIDDDSFSKLLPNWDVKVSELPEPMKSNYRLLGMAQLIYIYGGFTLPNSFLCTKNLKYFYETNCKKEKPFVCEEHNKHVNLSIESPPSLFIPGTTIFGGEKGDTCILEFVEYLKELNKHGHFTDERKLKGLVQYKLREWVYNEKMNLVDGKTIGIKTNKNKQILLEDLCEEAYLDIHPRAVGIHIPADEVLKRTKYSWLTSIQPNELLNTNLIIAKYMKASIQDTNNEYYKKTQEKSVVSI